MVAWDGPKASDNSGNVSRVFCNPQSGTNFTIGQTTVICEAVDGSGNRAACSFQVNVTGKSLCSVYKHLSDKGEGVLGTQNLFFAHFNNFACAF